MCCVVLLLFLYSLLTVEGVGPGNRSGRYLVVSRMIRHVEIACNFTTAEETPSKTYLKLGTSLKIVYLRFSD